jgi:hypothetical protein
MELFDIDPCELNKKNYDNEPIGPDLTSIKSYEDVVKLYTDYGDKYMNEYLNYDELIKDDIGLVDYLSELSDKDFIKSVNFMKNHGYNFKNAIYSQLHTIRKTEDNFLKSIDKIKIRLDLLHQYGAEFNSDEWFKQMKTKRVKINKLPLWLENYTPPQYKYTFEDIYSYSENALDAFISTFTIELYTDIAIKRYLIIKDLIDTDMFNDNDLHLIVKVGKDKLLEFLQLSNTVEELRTKFV